MDQYENPSEISKKELMQKLADLGRESSHLTRKDLEAAIKCFKVGYRQHHIPEDTQPEYLEFHEGCKAYLIVLEDGVTARKALKAVAEELDKGSEWVDNIINKRFYYARDIVKHHNHHPIQKAMIKDGSMRKKALEKADTPNSQLRELHEQRKLHTTINTLKGEVGTLQDNDQLQQAKLIKVEKEVDKMKKELNLSGLPDKEAAQLMKQAGISQKTISSSLNISPRTLRRWWKEL